VGVGDISDLAPSALPPNCPLPFLSLSSFPQPSTPPHPPPSPPSPKLPALPSLQPIIHPLGAAEAGGEAAACSLCQLVPGGGVSCS
ncbi:unnamed protein product, partial [Closterium sp. NIES-53]